MIAPHRLLFLAPSLAIAGVGAYGMFWGDASLIWAAPLTAGLGLSWSALRGRMSRREMIRRGGFFLVLTALASIAVLLGEPDRTLPVAILGLGSVALILASLTLPKEEEPST